VILGDARRLAAAVETKPATPEGRIKKVACLADRDEFEQDNGFGSRVAGMRGNRLRHL